MGHAPLSENVLFDNYLFFVLFSVKSKKINPFNQYRFEKYEKKNGVGLPKAYKSSNCCDSYALIIHYITEPKKPRNLAIFTCFITG